MTVLVANDPGMGLVIGMGLGTVFVGLICIIVICYIMGALIRVFEKPKPQEVPKSEPAAEAPIENKGELTAAISAVIAEEMGESVEAIRIKSIRRIS